MAGIRSHSDGEGVGETQKWKAGNKSLFLICDYKRMFAKEWGQAHLYKFDETG